MHSLIVYYNMSVDLNICRAQIGMHRFHLFKIKGLGKFDEYEELVFLSIILYQAGDIEKNPGPQSVDSSEFSSSCHFPFFQGKFFHGTLRCPKFAA